MVAFKNVLHATDFSPAARAALPVACALARDYGARLTLLHVRPAPEMIVGEFGVIPPEEIEPAAAIEQRLRALVPDDFDGAVACEVREGTTAREIVAAADAGDILVLGTHGRTGLSRIFMGSVAESVLREADCPVLTIRETAQQTAVKQAAADIEEELATVCAVASPAEAEIIRLALKQEGIRSFVENAQQAGLSGTLGNPVRVQVAAEDADRASKIIRQREAHRT